MARTLSALGVSFVHICRRQGLPIPQCTYSIQGDDLVVTGPNGATSTQQLLGNGIWHGVLVSASERPYSVRILPLEPIWPGFAINTIFYAAILWLLVAAPFALLHRIRARRGQCPACAYPVGTSNICTECGRPVKMQQ